MASSIVASRKASTPSRKTELSEAPGTSEPDAKTVAAASTENSLGPRLRAYRQSRGLGLKELAAVAGVSVGILSQIERGMNIPSLRTAEKLRQALGLSTGFFFEETRREESKKDQLDVVCRRDERPLLIFGKQGLTKQLLHRGETRVFEMMVIELPARSSSSISSYPSEKGALVLEGSVVFTIDGKSTELQVGDSLMFDGIRGHQLQNVSGHPAKVLWIIAKLPNELFL